MAVTKTNRSLETKESEQNIENQSFDEEFSIQVIEMMGYSSATNIPTRISVTSAGSLNVI